MKKTGFFYTDHYLDHKTGDHPESPDRLNSIVSFLKKNQLSQHLQWIEPQEAQFNEIALVHDAAYIERVQDSCRNVLIPFSDPDTIISTGSFQAALKAAGAVVDAIDRVLDGELDNAFCAVRPPGHHAEKDHGMGFCLFNNIAVGAKHALLKKGLKRILILDWDVHHGNGTQNSFYQDSSVFYVSIHQSPFYPGTGKSGETGQGNGKGYTTNFPLPAGSGQNEYYSIIEKQVLPIINDYKPEIILISAGFDAHVADPLAGMSLNALDYYHMTKKIVDHADKVCSGKVISTLEGGYNLEALGESVSMYIMGLLNIEPTEQ